MKLTGESIFEGERTLKELLQIEYQSTLKSAQLPPYSLQ
jgi:hypothetical protein